MHPKAKPVKKLHPLKLTCKTIQGILSHSTAAVPGASRREETNGASALRKGIGDNSEVWPECTLEKRWSNGA
jgi:hypothetical protein